MDKQMVGLDIRARILTASEQAGHYLIKSISRQVYGVGLVLLLVYSISSRANGIGPCSKWAAERMVQDGNKIQ